MRVWTLDPRQIAEDHERTKRRLTDICRTMISLKRLSEDDVDPILQKFEAFHYNGVLPHVTAFSNFDPYKDRVDQFFHERLFGVEKYVNLWKIVRSLLLLSHGQATVERGFSVNREVEQNNLAEASHVALRQINDHVDSVGGILNVELSRSLLVECASARSRYRDHCEQTRKRKAQEEKDEAEKAITVKKAKLETDIESLTKSADELAFKAEDLRNNKSRELLIQSNAIRRDVARKREELNKL